MALNDARIIPSKQVTVYAQELQAMRDEISRLRIELTNSKVMLGDWLDARPAHNRDDHRYECPLCSLHRSIAEALKNGR